MECPKCKCPELKIVNLSDPLPAHHCSQCEGNWIRAYDYEQWVENLEDRFKQTAIDYDLMLDFTPSNFDVTGALCPDCRNYMKRVNVPTEPSFYVEQCAACYGIWCDRGEWEVLTTLGLVGSINIMFSLDWQTQAREDLQHHSELTSLKDRMGVTLGNKIIELAKELQDHPHVDFAIAYLARQTIQEQEFNPINPLMQIRPQENKS